MKLDKNIASFVKTLNKISGVYPAASCGGHKHPSVDQLPEKEFYVIMKIRNKYFLKILKELVEFYNTDVPHPLSHLGYNKSFKTWYLGGFLPMVAEVFEPWAEDYLKTMNEYKPENKQQKFYSYRKEPPAEE